MTLPAILSNSSNLRGNEGTFRALRRLRSSEQSAVQESPSSAGGSHVSYKSINLRQKFGLFNEQWQPRVIAEMND
jgi:hypothetical protein